MTRRDEYTIFPADTARRAHAKEPEPDGPDFRPGDLPDSQPVTLDPHAPIRDPFDRRTRARADERPLWDGRWAS